MSLYLDSAYVAKCYINEPDSTKVRALVRQETDLQTSALSLAEMACIFQRHVRKKGLTRRQANELRSAFMKDVDDGVWLLHPVSEAMLRKVEIAVGSLPANVYLRAGDAIHLVTARDAGFGELWSNDRRLLDAARHFGLRGRS